MGQPYAQRIYLFQPETKQSDEPFQWFLGSNIVTLLNRLSKFTPPLSGKFFLIYPNWASPLWLRWLHETFVHSAMFIQSNSAQPGEKNAPSCNQV